MPLKFGSPTPDDLRDAGWAVAIHNDYRQNGESHTFWLFTKAMAGGIRGAKGEGRTDVEALDQVRVNAELVETIAATMAEGGGIEPRSF